MGARHLEVVFGELHVIAPNFKMNHDDRRDVGTFG
jgi:hypothetical protein